MPIRTGAPSPVRECLGTAPRRAESSASRPANRTMLGGSSAGRTEASAAAPECCGPYLVACHTPTTMTAAASTPTTGQAIHCTLLRGAGSDPPVATLTATARATDSSVEIAINRPVATRLTTALFREDWPGRVSYWTGNRLLASTAA